MDFPELIRIEVKTTTSEQVPLPARELEALATKGNAEAGILAALFWCGDRNVDGRWLIADAEQTFRKSGANAISVSKANMVRAHRSQPWLADLKEHITNNWPGFLHAFFNDAMAGHEVLCVVLADCHAAGNIAERLPKERILDTDHRDAVRSIIEQHGESVAGHVFQDLFAYLVGFAGYTNVLLNPVGVPDATVSGFSNSTDSEPATVQLVGLTLHEARRLTEHCERSGDDELAQKIRRQLPDT